MSVRALVESARARLLARGSEGRRAALATALGVALGLVAALFARAEPGEER